MILKKICFLYRTHSYNTVITKYGNQKKQIIQKIHKTGTQMQPVDAAGIL
ncbi:MAG: hypothetical protein PWQ17_23 [Anaerophaga sp.]|nr:hypothetical protein [Anaerophaga sp.]